MLSERCRGPARGTRHDQTLLEHLRHGRMRQTRVVTVNPPEIRGRQVTPIQVAFDDRNVDFPQGIGDAGVEGGVVDGVRRRCG